MALNGERQWDDNKVVSLFGRQPAGLKQVQVKSPLPPYDPVQSQELGAAIRDLSAQFQDLGTQVQAALQNQEAFQKAFGEGRVEVGLQQSPQAVVSPFSPDRLPGPVQFLNKLIEQWELTIADLTAILGFENEDTQVAEGLIAGRTSLRGRDLKDRVASLYRIKSLISTLLKNPAAERQWLNTASSEFDGKTPYEMLRQGSMQNLLTVRQYVEYISGL